MTRRPPRVSAVPGTSAASDQACFASMCWPRSSRGIATARRRWVIAAWVLVCRARIARFVRRRLRTRVLTRTHDRRLGLSLTSFVRLSGPVGKTYGPSESFPPGASSRLAVLWSCKRALSTGGGMPGALSTDLAGNGTTKGRVRRLPAWTPVRGATPPLLSVRPTPTCSTTPCRWWRPQAWRPR